jgi:uncharacterized membrane protein
MYRGKPNGLALFRQAVAYEAHRLNQELFRDHPQGPLPRREVEITIIKSVSKWTFDRYRGTRVWPVSGTGRPDRSRLSPAARALVPPLRGQEAEAARRRGLEVANQKRRNRAEEALLEALRRLQMRGERVTPTALARESGVHRVTASRWLKRMRGDS